MNNLEITIKNLTILRDGIKSAIERSTLRLDMDVFRGREVDGYDALSATNIDSIEEANKPECGTTGCILGFSPSVPGLAATEVDTIHGFMHYPCYSDRLFPCMLMGCDEWEFLFGAANTNCVNDFRYRAYKTIVKLSRRLQNG